MHFLITLTAFSIKVAIPICRQPLGTELFQSKVSLSGLSGDLHILQPLRERPGGLLPAQDPEQPETPFLSLPLHRESIAKHTDMSGASMGAAKVLWECWARRRLCRHKRLLKVDTPQVHGYWVNLLSLTLRGLQPHHHGCISEQCMLVLPRICQ